MLRYTQNIPETLMPKVAPKRPNFISIYATQKTRTGARDMRNRKPYRRKDVQRQAKATARKCEAGHFVSKLPVVYH